MWQLMMFHSTDKAIRLYSHIVGEFQKQELIMQIYKIKRLWGGKASIRSSIIEHIKKMKQQLRVEYQNGYMIINGDTPYEITAPSQIAQRTDEYIKKGQLYQLYDYEWNPTVVVTDYNKEGLQKLHDIYYKVFGNKDEQLSF